MYEFIVSARVRAHKKHGVNSLESGNRLYDREHNIPNWDNKQNRILVEEIGEISKSMNEFALGKLNWMEYEDSLSQEIIDAMAVLSAWYDKLMGISLEKRVKQLGDLNE